MVNKAKETEDLIKYSEKYLPSKLFSNISFLKDKSKDEISTFINHYSFAISITIVPLVTSYIWNMFMRQKISFVFFYPVVVFSSWYGGLLPGVLTTFISTFLIDYFFLAPSHVILKTSLSNSFMLLAFTIIGILISYSIESVRKFDKTKEYKMREKVYARLILKLQAENEKAQEEIQARDEFLSIASHELKTPLTSMLLQLESVIHNIKNVSLADFSIENLMKMLGNGEHQIKRLSRMINDLLNVSLITTGRLTLEPEEIDLNEIVEHVLANLSERIIRDEYKIDVKTTQSVIGYWDKFRIEQVVTNIVSNALKYGLHNPIEISISKHGNIAILTVKDHGIGISQKNKDIIFERFKRGVSEQDYKGLGIGLYITSQIVKAHHGKIKLDSQENKGSIFTIELPIKNTLISSNSTAT